MTLHSFQFLVCGFIFCFYLLQLNGSCSIPFHQIFITLAVFLQFGRCASDTGALFLRLLARLPVDVLLLLPNLNEGSALHTPDLLEVHCPQSVSLDRFPVDQNQARVTTAAYQAERDLDRLMYRDTGLYRNQQYAKASTVLLQTMYEEIPILWDQEMKYRPSFSAAGTP